MCSHISGNLAEIYIQKTEKYRIKKSLVIQVIIYYKKYVYDIIVILNKDRIKEEQILHAMNNVDET